MSDPDERFPLGYRYRSSMGTVFTVVGYFWWGNPGGDKFDHLARNPEGAVAQTPVWSIQTGQRVDDQVETRTYDTVVHGGRARHTQAQPDAEAAGVPAGYLPTHEQYNAADDTYTLHWEWIQPKEEP